VILSDDQGYGNYGFTGNPLLKTPNLDKLARTGIWLDNFYTDSVCAPTRAGLLTGRYALRCHVAWVGPYLHRDEVTIAEAFKSAGYATGIFGKWGFGGNYPFRPQEQGFDEVLVHLKGQFSPPQNKSAYFDPVVWHNGKERQFKGYCNDLWFDHAEEFIRKHRKSPFFVYLPTNLPHLPAQVPAEYSEPYMKDAAHDQIARAYGMIAHIDERVGRLVKTLKKYKLRENTIIIYFGDNGAAWDQELIYTGGLRGKKARVYEGGIRQPCLISWPARWKEPRKINTIAAHIDIMPTLLAAANIKMTEVTKIDGKNLLPLLDGTPTEQLKHRTIFQQGYPTGFPAIRRCFMVRGPRYKLVQQVGRKKVEGVDWKNWPEELFKYELYDMQSDPGEANDIAAKHPELVASMLKEYEAWYADVSKNPGSTRPHQRDHVGHDGHPRLRLLTYGGKEIDIQHEGPYRIILEPYGVRKTLPGDIYADTPFVASGDGDCSFALRKLLLKGTVRKGDKVHVFENIRLPLGKHGFRATFNVEGEQVFNGHLPDTWWGPLFVTFERME
jgi:arylsulfatase A-like enzyme